MDTGKRRGENFTSDFRAYETIRYLEVCFKSVLIQPLLNLQIRRGRLIGYQQTFPSNP